jgi:hypothetical protein
VATLDVLDIVADTAARFKDMPLVVVRDPS